MGDDFDYFNRTRDGQWEIGARSAFVRKLFPSTDFNTTDPATCVPVSPTDKAKLDALAANGPDVYTSGSPALVASLGGRTSILTGTASAPVLPDAASNLGLSIVVSKFDLAADLVIGRSGSDKIAGGDTGVAATQYTLTGANTEAVFVSVQHASLNGGVAFWKASPGLA